MGPSCRARGAGAAPSPTPAAPTRPTGPCPATPSHAPAGLRRGRAPRPGWSRAPRLRLGGAPVRPGWGRRRGDGAVVPAGREKGPRPPPPPPGTVVPGFLPGSASRLQPKGTPSATLEPARLLTRTPPLSSLLAPEDTSRFSPSRRPSAPAASTLRRVSN